MECDTHLPTSCTRSAAARRCCWPCPRRSSSVHSRACAGAAGWPRSTRWCSAQLPGAPTAGPCWRRRCPSRRTPRCGSSGAAWRRAPAP
jgi:hypothetical protein